MVKYAVVGGHGSGKSTFAYMLATYFKQQGQNVDVVQERVRYSPFPINESMNEQTALWVYHSHIARELESIARGFNITICDRSALDSFIYAEHFRLDTRKLNICKNNALKWLETYDKIFFIEPSGEIINDGIRGLDKEYQSSINTLFKDHLELASQYLKVNVCILKASEIFNDDFNIEKAING